ncbi:MAG TPA: NUDIX domain-containing protein [Pyrinomonadaceae bacterium]|nr:NUDIX domain-containing protein [Pyrinomonadaceae bacterium]
MLKNLVAGVWRRAPVWVRRAGVWLTHTRFLVTAGAVVCDERGRVLLLRHRLRPGEGWGIPGGFLAPGEQPEEALRREMREETGLELEAVELAFARTLPHVRQVEVIFRCALRAAALEGRTPSFEIERAAWFDPAALPDGLSADQRGLIGRALAGRAKSAE